MEQEMEKRKEGTSEEEKWVHDASVDYKGRLPFRASTGVWKASLFVLSNERGISILRRISIGMTFSVIVMVAAALVEAKRLRIVGQRTMSVMWLIPQYLILGIANSFSLVGLQEYFYDQVPDSMRSIGMALYLSVTGVGNFLSSFLIIIVNHVTGKNGKSWIGKDINSSRLDRFYWMLAVINALDLCAFLFLARSYTYKTVQRRTMDTDGCNKSDGVETVAK
ncbi:hypothetical protein JHK84_032306 [Glycine max]|nr:hypothetical protein JHK84_032306 [Glycine max]